MDSNNASSVFDMNRATKLVNGYIYEFGTKYDKQIPNEIADIVILFHGYLKNNYIGYFNTQNAAYRIEIQSDKLTLKGYHTAKLDSALPVSLENTKISKIWRWRATTTKENIHTSCAIFGVISNQCTEFDVYAYYSTFVDPYGICPIPNSVFKGTNNVSYYEYTYTGFKADDVIRMEYMIFNGTKCKLSFYNESNNNEFLYSMNLPNNDRIKHWYPVFGLGINGGNIKVIPY